MGGNFVSVEEGGAGERPLALRFTRGHHLFFEQAREREKELLSDPGTGDKLEVRGVGGE